MPATRIQLREINERNRQFWAEQCKLLSLGMGDAIVRQTFLDVLSDEEMRGIPVYYRTSIYKALEKAARYRRLILAELGSKGGKSKTPDALRCLIEAMVQDSPEMSEKELLDAVMAPAQAFGEGWWLSPV